jgi:hypothetical protein
MQVLYDSDSFAVVAFEIAVPGAVAAPPRGGFEIVDKFAKKDIFIEGELAERFKTGAIELMAREPSEEEIDEYIGGFTFARAQTLALH